MKISHWKFVVPIAAMLIAQAAFADSAPFESPACAYTFNKDSAPTCSYLSTYVKIDISEWNKDYVLVSESYLKGVDDSGIFTIITEPSINIGGYAPYYFLPKSYLTAHGGFDKLFTYTTLPGELSAYRTMKPKNPAEFARQIVPFVASTSDIDLNLDLSPQHLVGTKYAKVPIPNNPYHQLPLDSKDRNSEWSVVYAPTEKFCEKTKCYAVLTQIKKERLLGKGDMAPQSSDPGYTLVMEEISLPPWYVRLWNWIKSLL